MRVQLEDYASTAARMMGIRQGVAKCEPAQCEGQANTHAWDGQVAEVLEARGRGRRGAAAAAEIDLAKGGEVRLCYGGRGDGDRECTLLKACASCRTCTRTGGGSRPRSSSLHRSCAPRHSYVSKTCMARAGGGVQRGAACWAARRCSTAPPFRTTCPHRVQRCAQRCGVAC